MAGSCRFAKKLLTYGYDMLIVERNINAPEYKPGLLDRPTEKRLPGEACKEMRDAQGGRDARARAFIELCSCRDLKPEDLPTLDVAHFSPTCASVSCASNDKHPRNEDNDFWGPPNDQMCIEYNLDRTRQEAT